MGRKRVGRAVKAARKQQLGNQEDHYKSAPHSFVFHRGHVGKNIKILEMDIRKLMEPYTARHLQVRKKNVLKDFVNVAGALNVSHFVILTKTEISTNMKIARAPKGPTLTFKVQSFSLAKDILSSLKKQSMNPMIFNHPPLLVMNNFSGEGLHLKLMTTMFQNMFPSISVNQVKLDHIKRCILLNYEAEDKTVTMRHYMISIKPVGLSRPVKKLIKAKLPDLGKFADVDEYLMQGNVSESEGEQDGPDNEVTLPQSVSSRGNLKSTQSAIRLTEVGPRLTLKLVKIEEGMCEGEVMFHEFIQKTSQDMANLKAMREKKRNIKMLRKQEQSENVRKKELAKEEHKKKSLSGMKDRKTETDDDGYNSEGAQDTGDDDDDYEYFRQEVGQEPDKDLLLSSGNKRKQRMEVRGGKKRRKDNTPNQGSPERSVKKANRGDKKFNKANKNINKTDLKLKKSDKNFNKSSKRGGLMKGKSTAPKLSRKQPKTRPRQRSGKRR
ncbi:suppressor of SWI4 1 homolog isoform X2 [Liolophura sinensis]|uniref:suppressor of SWI4 1 homolog isoform X2 n=1 Tax=Liolophura sinensis TaxID=3198878 RepID=UPI003158CDA8